MRFLIPALAITLAAGAASAQPWGGGPPQGQWGQQGGGQQGGGQSWNNNGPGAAPRAVLYELPGFQGRSITVNATAENMAPLNFNDVAQSARLQGRWRVCEDSGYRSKCKDISGDVPDLAAVGMTLRISSLQAYAENVWSRSGGWGRGAPQPYEGLTGVLFPYPNIAGFDISPNSGGASAFCRSVGLGSSAYYDSSQRANMALDGEGRYVAQTAVIRDVFCRKR